MGDQRERLDWPRGSKADSPIQFRKDQLKEARPACPRGCSGIVHAHGHYLRYIGPKALRERERIQRYLCYVCRLTLSVLPAHRLPYRLVWTDRLQADFDCRAGIQTQGLDPPPSVVEAGCLQRAWSSLSARVGLLQEAFGQLLDGTSSEVTSLWKDLRQAMDSVPRMLCFLAEHHHISLLGNYRCLGPPP